MVEIALRASNIYFLQLTVLGENGVHGDNVLPLVVGELERETEQSLRKQCIMAFHVKVIPISQ